VLGIWQINRLFQDNHTQDNLRKIEKKNIDKVMDTLNSENEPLVIALNNNSSDLEKELEGTIKIDKIINENSRSGKSAEIKSALPTSKYGEIYIKCYPWANVHLNNKYVETTPLSKNINAETGSYLLTLTHPDFPKYSDSIKISSEEVLFVEVNLDTLFGLLECKVYPWAELYIDEISLGITPLESPLKLNEGTYKLTLKNPKYAKMESQIDIRKSDTLRINFNLAARTIN